MYHKSALSRVSQEYRPYASYEAKKSVAENKAHGRKLAAINEKLEAERRLTLAEVQRQEKNILSRYAHLGLAARHGGNTLLVGRDVSDNARSAYSSRWQSSARHITARIPGSSMHDLQFRGDELDDAVMSLTEKVLSELKHGASDNSVLESECASASNQLGNRKRKGPRQNKARYSVDKCPGLTYTLPVDNGATLSDDAELLVECDDCSAREACNGMIPEGLYMYDGKSRRGPGKAAPFGTSASRFPALTYSFSGTNPSAWPTKTEDKGKTLQSFVSKASLAPRQKPKKPNISLPNLNKNDAMVSRNK